MDSLVEMHERNADASDSLVSNLQFANHELENQIEENKVELKRRRKNIFKGTVAGFFAGVVSVVVFMLI